MALKVDWEISSSCQFFYYYVILNVWVNFKLQEGKLNFGNLFSCFVNRFFSCRFVLDIEYSRQFSIVVWGIAFPLGRNNRMNFLEESAETRLVGANWYWRIYQRIGSFSQWKAYLWDIASSKFLIISLKNYGLVILILGVTIFMTAGILWFCLPILAHNDRNLSSNPPRSNFA